MPRFPEISVPAGAIPSSIFARLVGELARHKGEVYPFHLGDTHLSPPDEARLERIAWDEASAGKLYNYAAPVGDAELIQELARKLQAKNRIPATSAHIQITAGATHAFACATRAILDTHDEVLLLSPYWPLIRGHVLAAGARPVEVPFTSRLYDEPGVDPVSLLEEYVGPRTAAIYLINPNNPDGKVLGERELRAIAAVAHAHDLWVLADEVYEDFTFDGRQHLSIASLPRMAERTLTAFSFSKSYGQAGLRVGYMVGPEKAMVPIKKLANHTIYNVPRAMQRAALAALRCGEEFLARARVEYASARDLTLAKLTVPYHASEGGSFVFLNLSRWAKEGSAMPVLEKLAGEGILLAPGDAFGRQYAAWARFCYTAVSRPRLEAGLDRMAAVLAAAG
jgi:aspartate/methionine/tyrosine aminotransferase